MGLKERRFTKTFQEETFPGLKQQIDTAAGFEVEMLIEWETLFEESFVHLYQDSYPKIYFIPLIEAFKAIASDSLGREALRTSLQKVVINNQDNHHNPSSAYSFKEGVLEINHSPILNADKVEDRIEVLTELLENNL